MDRKRFRAKLNEAYLDELFPKKSRKFAKGGNVKSIETTTKTITHIPLELLAKPNNVSTKPREYEKPENWIKPIKNKPSAQEILEAEKQSIKKKMGHLQAFCRGARNLSPVIISSENKDDETEKRRLLKRTSRQYLQEYIQKNNCNIDRCTETKVTPNPTKVANLVFNILPGDDEVTL